MSPTSSNTSLYSSHATTLISSFSPSPGPSSFPAKIICSLNPHANSLALCLVIGPSYAAGAQTEIDGDHVGSPWSSSTGDEGISTSCCSCELCWGIDCNSSCWPQVALAVVGINLDLIVTVDFLEQTILSCLAVVITGGHVGHDHGFKHGYILFAFTVNSQPAILITSYVQSDNFLKTLCAGDQYFLNLLTTPPVCGLNHEYTPDHLGENSYNKLVCHTKVYFLHVHAALTYQLCHKLLWTSVSRFPNAHELME